MQRICKLSDFYRKVWDVLLAFTSASAVDNLWSICLEVNTLDPFPYFSLHLPSDSQIIKSLKTSINFFSNQKKKKKSQYYLLHLLDVMI